MTTLTNARRFLIASSIPTGDMTNEQIINKAIELGFTEKEKPDTKPTTTKPKTKKETKQKMDTTDTIADEISSAIKSVLNQHQQPQQIDEEQIINLINKHATKTIHVEHYEQQETIKIDCAHSQFEHTLKLTQIAPITKVWPYLRGPAGSGKTTLAAQLAKALGVPFYDTASVNDKFELIGFMRPDGEYNSTPFYQAMKFGGIFLFDEIDASAPEAITAFNMALSNATYTFPNGERVKQHQHCYFIAAGNTFGNGATAEYSTRELLDGATRNRFVEIVVDYDLELETKLALHAAQTIKPKITEKDIEPILKALRAARKVIKKHKLDVIISPRQSIQGAAMVAQGFTTNETLDHILQSDFSPAQQTEIHTEAA